MNERVSESNLRLFIHSFNKNPENIIGKSDALFACYVAPTPNNNNNMSINVQHDAAICRLLFSVTLLDMFRVSCTHHQEYQHDTRNMSSSVTENKSLYIAASCWTFIDIES